MQRSWRKTVSSKGQWEGGSVEDGDEDFAQPPHPKQTGLSSYFFFCFASALDRTAPTLSQRVLFSFLFKWTVALMCWLFGARCCLGAWAWRRRGRRAQGRTHFAPVLESITTTAYFLEPGPVRDGRRFCSVLLPSPLCVCVCLWRLGGLRA